MRFAKTIGHLCIHWQKAVRGANYEHASFITRPVLSPAIKTSMKLNEAVYRDCVCVCGEENVHTKKV